MRLPGFNDKPIDAMDAAKFWYALFEQNVAEILAKIELYNFKIDTMEQPYNMIESLLDKTTEYGKTSFDLAKLKTLNKASDVVSDGVLHLYEVMLVVACLLFLSLGIAIWLGAILGQAFWGFLIVAGFYALLGLALRYVLHKWCKVNIDNYIIKLILK